VHDDLGRGEVDDALVAAERRGRSRLLPWSGAWRLSRGVRRFSCRRPCVACASAVRNHGKRLLSTVGPCGALAALRTSRWCPRTTALAVPLRPLPVRRMPLFRPSQDSNVCTCDPSHNYKGRCGPVGRWCPQPLNECTLRHQPTTGLDRQHSSRAEQIRESIRRDDHVQTHPSLRL
jgi:hypothetical protein